VSTPDEIAERKNAIDRNGSDSDDPQPVRQGPRDPEGALARHSTGERIVEQCI